MTNIVVWAVGSWQSGEFAGLVESVSTLEITHQAATVDAACQDLAQWEVGPELILLAQPLPDTYSQAEMTRLQRAAPLARLVVLAGTWCEGELRTGKPLVGVVRLYWHELAAWWSAVRRHQTAGAAPPWSAPLDGPLAGRIAPPSLKPGPCTPELAGVFAIDSQLWATFATLRETLQPYGAQCRWVRRRRPVDWPGVVTAGIWDGGQLDPPELADLRQFAQAVTQRGGVTLVMVDFPRREHREMVRAAGGLAVMGKPYVGCELASLLAELSSQPVDLATQPLRFADPG